LLPEREAQRIFQREVRDAGLQTTKATHYTLPISRRLMAAPGPIVDARDRRDEHVLHASPVE